MFLSILLCAFNNALNVSYETIHSLHNNNLHNRAILALLSKYAQCLPIYFMALKLKYII